MFAMKELSKQYLLREIIRHSNYISSFIYDV